MKKNRIFLWYNPSMKESENSSLPESRPVLFKEWSAFGRALIFYEERTGMRFERKKPLFPAGVMPTQERTSVAVLPSSLIADINTVVTEVINAQQVPVPEIAPQGDTQLLLNPSTGE